MKKYFLIIIGVFLIIYFSLEIFMIGSFTTCGKFEKSTFIRGGENFTIKYKIENKDYRTIINPESLKKKSIEELKKCNCIKVKVSRIFKNIAFVNDDNI